MQCDCIKVIHADKNGKLDNRGSTVHRSLVHTTTGVTCGQRRKY